MTKLEGGFSSMVVSTRVRLARNVRGYSYRALTPVQYQEIANRVWTALNTVPALASAFTMTAVQANSPEGAALVERHLISPELAAAGGYLIATEDGGIAIMIGEEDHIRLQVIGTGLCPKECMAEAKRLAALLENEIPMDFDASLGYLTACPSNLGTGARASVMLHLPLLQMGGHIQDVIAGAGRLGFTVRGAYGEGSEAVGGFFQLSNQVTLGISEDAIIDQLITLTTEVIESEKRLRELARAQYEPVMADRIYRAVGVLQTARLIQTGEALDCLSHVLVGLSMGYLTGMSPSEIYRLEYDIRPALLGGAASDRDWRRAALLREAVTRLTFV